jgi:anthranilate phosphoribosyltransferase
MTDTQPEEHEEKLAELTQNLLSGQELIPQQAADAVNALLEESTGSDAKADFLVALRQKGESALEIKYFVDAILKFARDPEIDFSELPGPAIDIVGTGGDKLGLFNVSTTAAILLAAGGAVVIKHGNRGITSKSGGADVLESLGIATQLAPAELRESLRRTGFGFLFAPQYHPAFKAVGPVRKQLAEKGVATIFNKLGPLLNPAQPPYQMAGVFAYELLGQYADVLRHLGRERAMVVHSDISETQGADEMTTSGTNHVFDVHGERITSFEVTAQSLNLQERDLKEIQGGDAAENARILEEIVTGKASAACEDVAVLNAAAGFVVTGLEPNLGRGMGRARETIRSGAAGEKLQQIREFQP